MRTAIRGLALLAILALTIACDRAPTAKESSICTISEYGVGVYYFHCTERFGEALAEFRRTRKVISIASYTVTRFGTTGYWVLTEGDYTK